MAERVLSIEVGHSLTKVCEVENAGKTPKIFNSFVIPTPDGMVRDGAVDVNDEFVNQFLRMMTVKKIKTKKAIFTVSSNKIATREAVLPYLKDKNIYPMSYCPLAQGGSLSRGILQDETVLKIARNHNLSPSQVLLAFVLANEDMIAKF